MTGYVAGPAGALGQVSRLLTLVPLLHVTGGMRLNEAAAAVGVTPQQVLKDLKVLFLCGLPGGFPDELIDVNIDALETEDGEMVPDGLIRIDNADYLSRPLRLTPTEAMAMIVALRALGNDATPHTKEIVDRAVAKIEAAVALAPGGTRIDPGTDAADPAHEELAGRLRSATQERRQVRLSYYVPARDETSQRVVDPHGVVTAGPLTYLDAWCHQAQDVRLFRLDRVTGAEVLDTPVSGAPRAPRDLSSGPLVDAPEGSTVRIKLAAPATWVVEYFPVEVVRRHRNGSVEVTMVVADQRWLTRFLLRLAPHASVVSPDHHQADFRAAAAATLRLYDRGTRTMNSTDSQT